MTRGAFEIGQAMRRLRRSPGYVAAFVLTLGLAIGVNGAVFSVVNAVLLQPLPVPEADRILYLKHPVRALGIDHAMFSFMEVDDYRAGATTLDEIVEFRAWEFTVVGEGEPHRAVGGMITSNYFSLMDMRPGLGRVLGADDDGMDAEPAIVLTDAYWERTFGRDPRVLGRLLELESLRASDPLTAARVVGVLEPGFRYTGSSQPHFYANYAANAHYQSGSMRDSRGHRMTDIFARMAPGVSLETADAELQAIANRVLRDNPDSYDPDRRYGLDVVRWKDELAQDGRTIFLFLMGTVALVLVLAAANVANLTLTRLIRKQSELSTRAALGARHSDLRLQLTAEHFLLGVLGGVLGVALAFMSRDALVGYASRFSVRAQEVEIDWLVLGATLGGSILVSVLLAWLPGLPVNPGTGRVASSQGRATDSLWRKRLQRGLVVGQLALSFTLLTGAGLLVRSLVALTSVESGFESEQVLTVRAPTGPRGTPYLEADPGWEAAVEDIRSYPGVLEAAVATWAPLSDPTPPIAWGIRIEDGDEGEFDRSHLSSGNSVSPGYFEILRIPLEEGRYFDRGDVEGGVPVIILNASMARAHFRDTNPIGRRIMIEPDGLTVFSRRWYEVVGVVADAREYGLGVEGMHTYYRPSAQNQWGPAVVASYQGDASDVARHVEDVLHRMQPNRAVQEAQTLTSLVLRDRAPARLNAILFGSFAALALLIAALGVLATLAFSVGQRVREFGIRMAVGADRSSVLRNVLGEGVLLVGAALLVGVAASLLLGRFLEGLLYQEDPVDPIAMAMAAVVLGSVALAAALLPALRATRIHPTEALRAQ
ncbi:MAG: ADOP family duplicated permease [Gemmatimonadota bacterium]